VKQDLTVPCGFLLGGIGFTVVDGKGGLAVCGGSSVNKFFTHDHYK